MPPAMQANAAAMSGVEAATNGVGKPEERKRKRDETLDTAEIVLRSRLAVLEGLRAAQEALKTLEDISTAASSSPMECESAALAVPSLLCRFRSEYRHLSGMVSASSQLVDSAKTTAKRKRCETAQSEYHLEWLRKRIRAEESFECPMYNRVKADLVDEAEFEEKCRDLPWWVSKEEDPYRYTLNRIRFEESERDAAIRGFEEANTKREVAEDRLRQSRKKEAENVARLAPLEKEMIRASEFFGACPNPSSVDFPLSANQLPQPLLSLYSSFFAYRCLSDDRSVTSTPVEVPGRQAGLQSPLFEIHPMRVNITVDRKDAPLPPTSFPNVPVLFPLSVRAAYLPKLELVVAITMLPKTQTVGDCLFLSNLFGSEDDGGRSPNPLHLVLQDIHKLDITNETTTKSAAKPFEESTGNAAVDISKALSDLGVGRPFAWLQAAAGVKWKVKAASTKNVQVEAPHPSAIISALRKRVARRSWTLYQLTMLKQKPSFPVPHVPLLHGALSPAMSSYSDFSEVDVEAFKSVAPRLTPSVPDVGSVVFFQARLTCKAHIFGLMGAVPIDDRPSMFHIRLTTRPALTRSGWEGVGVDRLSESEASSLHDVLKKESKTSDASSSLDKLVEQARLVILPASTTVLETRSGVATHYKDSELETIMTSMWRDIPSSTTTDPIQGNFALSTQLVYIATKIESLLSDVSSAS